MAKNQTNTGAMRRTGKGKTQTAKAAKARPATRTATARTARKTATRTSKTTQKARPMEGPAGRRLHRKARQEGAPPATRLQPITQRQSRDQIIATIATDSGVERPIVERVARSLSQTLTRHLMRNGSGRVDIPYLGAALWRGREGARPARKMASPLLKGRIVEIPARRAMSVARIKVHSALREIVARA